MIEDRKQVFRGVPVTARVVALGQSMEPFVLHDAPISIHESFDLRVEHLVIHEDPVTERDRRPAAAVDLEVEARAGPFYVRHQTFNLIASLRTSNVAGV